MSATHSPLPARERGAAHIAIAGAGLAGRLMAWALARQGHRVCVYEASCAAAPAFDGQGAAAFTAAGMLSPLAELEKAEAGVAALGWASLRLWPLIVARLAQAQQPVALSLRGSLLLAHRSDLGAAQRVLARLSSHPELGQAQALDTAALQQLEPALQRSGGLHGWLLQGEGLIHPVQAMAALHADACAHGASFHWSSPVTAVTPGALQLQDGRCVSVDWAVDTRALGARAQLPGLRGVRGEVVALHAPEHGLTRPVRLLHPRHRIYLVPRSSTELVLGASELETEDRGEVTVQSAVELMAAAHSVLPQLGEARITRLDRNLRPALPDNAPLAQHQAGLLRVNGLYRHGWLLAPALVQQLLQATGLASLEI
ncbi:FAD-dependent oxidoreductase [Roseateles sp. BYS180W]|uniref:FAD-dependent oxidoreductase n=1 Tax=Roseateles rivi TaxID=3299028 RepID=A0ABW7FWT9_9BURK